MRVEKDLAWYYIKYIFIAIKIYIFKVSINVNVNYYLKKGMRVFFG